MVAQLLPFITASVLLTVSPGPDIIYVLVQSIVNGKKAGLLTTVGLALGILIHTSLVAFGISAIIQDSSKLFLIIRICGACYMFFLAYRVFKASGTISLKSGTVIQKDLKLLRQGFVMNVLNPKVTIFFLAFFPGFLWNPSVNTQFQFFVLGALFMLQTLIIFGTVALLAGRISTYIDRHPSLGAVLKWVQIIVFVGIGIFIFF